MLLDWCRAKTRSYEVSQTSAAILYSSLTQTNTGLRLSFPALVMFIFLRHCLSVCLSTWTFRTSHPAGATGWRFVPWCTVSSPTPLTTTPWAPAIAGKTLRWPSTLQSEYANGCLFHQQLCRGGCGQPGRDNMRNRIKKLYSLLYTSNRIWHTGWSTEVSSADK